MTDARPGVGFLENRRRETTMSDKKWIKAEDVARLAGVSRSAVSRTFTPGASVSEKTRQKVLSAAEALGYQVNIIARTMITGSSNFIGIVTAGFDNPFRSKLLAPLVHQLALNGFMPLLMNADLRRAAAVAGGGVSGAQDPRHPDQPPCGPRRLRPGVQR